MTVGLILGNLDVGVRIQLGRSAVTHTDLVLAVIAPCNRCASCHHAARTGKRKCGADVRYANVEYQLSPHISV